MTGEKSMFRAERFRTSGFQLVALCWLLFLASFSHGESKIMGEVEFVAATPVEKHSGIWVDGQYVGYLDELKGDRKVMLLPGEHEVVARESGYKDFPAKILVEPGQKQTTRISLVKDPQARLPAVTAEVKLEANPARAAVFMDGSFLGPVHDFGGTGRALLISPGKHRIKIALPGYQTFETEINLVRNQKFRVKTDLVKGSITQAGPLIKEQ
jgi:hypothetical protein